jgi:hypothetical protein
MARARFAAGARISVSVAESLPAFGSSTPTIVATVAVFTSVPMAMGSTVPLSIRVTLCPAGSERPVHAPESGLYEPTTGVKTGASSAAGTVSFNCSALTASGPWFVTVIVYVSGEPGTATVVPSSWATARSAFWNTVVLSSTHTSPTGWLWATATSSLPSPVEVPGNHDDGKKPTPTFTGGQERSHSVTGKNGNLFREEISPRATSCRRLH